jgi:hypothetical protein
LLHQGRFPSARWKIAEIDLGERNIDCRKYLLPRPAAVIEKGRTQDLVPRRQ